VVKDRKKGRKAGNLQKKLKVIQISIVLKNDGGGESISTERSRLNPVLKLEKLGTETFPTNPALWVLIKPINVSSVERGGQGTQDAYRDSLLRCVGSVAWRLAAS